MTGNGTRFCAECGQLVALEAAFCGGCGARTDAAGDVVSTDPSQDDAVTSNSETAAIPVESDRTETYEPTPPPGTADDAAPPEASTPPPYAGAPESDDATVPGFTPYGATPPPIPPPVDVDPYAQVAAPTAAAEKRGGGATKALLGVAAAVVIAAGAFIGVKMFSSSDADADRAVAASTTQSPTPGASGMPSAGSTSTPTPAGVASPAPTAGTLPAAPTAGSLQAAPTAASGTTPLLTPAAPSATMVDSTPPTDDFAWETSGLVGHFTHAGSLNSGTTHPFVVDVAEKYNASGAGGQPTTVIGYSEKLKKDIPITCRPRSDGNMYCYGGNAVEIVLWR